MLQSWINDCYNQRLKTRIQYYLGAWICYCGGQVPNICESQKEEIVLLTVYGQLAPWQEHCDRRTWFLATGNQSKGTAPERKWPGISCSAQAYFSTAHQTPPKCVLLVPYVASKANQVVSLVYCHIPLLVTWYPNSCP